MHYFGKHSDTKTTYYRALCILSDNLGLLNHSYVIMKLLFQSVIVTTISKTFLEHRWNNNWVSIMKKDNAKMKHSV